MARKTRDKGAWDAVRAFAKYSVVFPEDKLFFLGPVEEKIPEDIENILRERSSCVVVENKIVKDVDYLTATDVLVLPSYREGFGSVVIKAAALGVPTVAYEVYGLTDSVSLNNGWLSRAGDIDAFVDSMIKARKILASETNSKYISGCVSWGHRFSSDMFATKWVEFHRKMLVAAD